MAGKTKAAEKPPRWYRGADIPMRVIRQFAREVAERFQPDKIILFGSYASGTPHQDSDVDVLVVMPCRNQIDQACRIDDVFDPPFPLDLIVRTPVKFARGQASSDPFVCEIVAKGKVLYEKDDRPLGEQS